MDLALSPAFGRPRQGWQRATGVALVALLHLLLLFVMLHAVLRPTVSQRANEAILVLPALPKPAPPTERAPVPSAAPPAAIILPPPFVPPPDAAPLTTPNIQGLGQSLFRCAPEMLANLPPEQRARCPGSGMTPGDGLAVGEPRSQVKDPELRAAEITKRNTPFNVPCVTIQTRALGTTAQYHIVMVDPLCALKEHNR